MADPSGESACGPLRLDFDRRLMLRFPGAMITSDVGLLAYRELDDARGLTASADAVLADAHTGRNGRHALVGLLRQSVFGRLAGYKDVNDAERLRCNRAMRWVVGDQAVRKATASASQMGRFGTEWLTRPENLAALADLPDRWIDRVHGWRRPRIVVLNMDSSESPTHGERREALTTVTSAARATTRCSRSTSSATWSGARCGRAMGTAPTAGAWLAVPSGIGRSLSRRGFGIGSRRSPDGWNQKF